MTVNSSRSSNSKLRNFQETQQRKECWQEMRAVVLCKYFMMTLFPKWLPKSHLYYLYKTHTQPIHCNYKKTWDTDHFLITSTHCPPRVKGLWNHCVKKNCHPELIKSWISAVFRELGELWVTISFKRQNETQGSSQKHKWLIVEMCTWCDK